MSERAEILSILGDLVACDTQNPPREISADSSVFDCIRRRLDDSFNFVFQDFGNGRVNLLATRGNACRLINVHLDTVPVGNGWSKPPIHLTVESDKVYGRGVCDIKGAAACLIAAAKDQDNVAILFSSDEEGADSCCIAEFCSSNLIEPFEEVVVAEPTGCLAVTGHRGYLSVRGSFSGEAGHTSQHHRLANSANHRAVIWIAEAFGRVRQFESETLNGQSACFNVGRIDGGIKNNMIADQCLVTWSARLPSGCLNRSLTQCLFENGSESIDWQVTFDGDALPAKMEQRFETRQRCEQLELPMADDVDFWTEAAIFSLTGRPTFVLGPGHIEQAHTPDEWIAIEQLEKCVSIYRHLMNQH